MTVGKNSGGSEINNANQYYSQMANNSNQLLQQFNQLYLPMLQQLIPELQSTVNGQNSPLMQAAEAPVNAQTSRLQNTMQNNIGGTINPNALWSDMALTGQTQAGLSADQMLSQSLSALQNLAGMGYGSVNTAQNSLGTAAGGEGTIGSNLNASNNAMWGSIFQGLGAAAGGIPSAGGGNQPAPAQMPSPSANTLQGYNILSGQPYGTGASAPISQQQQPNNVFGVG
jgi:superoxide dismutase